MVRGTMLLNRFIESGALPESDLPTGLNNIGNTCYLNSLLQYYYSLSPLYNRVMSFSPDNITTPKTPLVVDERPVSEEEVQQAHLFATHLKALFIILSENNGHLSVSPSQQLALMALGHMDVQPIHQDIDSVVSSMRQVTKADNAPQSLQPLSTPKEPGNISPSPLQSPLVGNSVPGDSNVKDLTEAQDTPDNNTDLIDLNSDDPAPSAPSPMDIGEKSPMDESMVVEETLALGSQQDVSECMDHMMRLMERSFLSQPNQPDSNLIKELFYGKTRQIIKYTNPKTGELVKSTKLEEFSNLILNIQDRSCGLYDCLDEYFQTSKVEMTDVEADRELAIESAPPFLQIQLQRVQFDPKLLQAYKSQAYIELTDTLHLDWYMTKHVDQLESNSQSPHFRQEAMKIRDIIRESKDKVKFLNGNRNNYTYGESLSKTINYYETQLKEYDQQSASPLAEYLEPQPEPNQLDQTLKILNNHSNHLNAVIEQNTQHMELGEQQLQSILSQAKDSPYHLHAVFIHSGK
jgi:ubiquitin carboxyl-terminal hydrolase 25/28